MPSGHLQVDVPQKLGHCSHIFDDLLGSTPMWLLDQVPWWWEEVWVGEVRDEVRVWVGEVRDEVWVWVGEVRDEVWEEEALNYCRRHCCQHKCQTYIHQ